MLGSIQLLKAHTEHLEAKGRAGRGDAHPLSGYQENMGGVRLLSQHCGDQAGGLLTRNWLYSPE